MHGGAQDDKVNPIMRDYYNRSLTTSGNTQDDILLAKFDTVYTGSSYPGSFVVRTSYMAEWLVLNRVNACAGNGLVLGPMRFHLSFHVVCNFPPYEAFVFGRTNSVREYKEGIVGSGWSYKVG
ncbi:hypothetical protein RDI58_026893 [Solanum bulbocastanum]|uniref:Uncharacterized protein n=1 Tax=Solanum bulbocastanum TaxID=147425 RepID=A0AAN8SZV4_SOLBU